MAKSKMMKLYELPNRTPFKVRNRNTYDDDNCYNENTYVKHSRYIERVYTNSIGMKNEDVLRKLKSNILYRKCKAYKLALSYYDNDLDFNKPCARGNVYIKNGIVSVFNKDTDVFERHSFVKHYAYYSDDLRKFVKIGLELNGINEHFSIYKKYNFHYTYGNPDRRLIVLVSGIAYCVTGYDKFEQISFVNSNTKLLVSKTFNLKMISQTQAIKLSIPILKTSYIYEKYRKNII